MNKHICFIPNIRKSFLALCIFSFTTLLACAQSTKQLATPDNLSTSPFKMNEVKLTGGLFKHAEQKEAEYLLKIDADKLLSGFRTEAGLKAKAEKYGGWENLGVAGHSLGHYLSACAMYYATSGDTSYAQRVNYILDELEICQNENSNGYLAATPNGKQIFTEVSAGNIRSQGFDLNGSWVPLYVMHKVLAGLIDAYQYAHNPKALTIATRLTDWMYNTFANLNDEQMQQVLACEFGGMNEALANLYAYTSDKKILSLARKFDNHKAIMNPLADGKDKLEGQHANTQIPKIIGAARLFELTGEKRDSLIATFFWNTVVNHHTYVNGGNSDWEHFGAPDKLNDRLDLNTTETCNTYNMLKLTRHLFSWNACSKYSDYYERALYNHILSSQNPDDGMCVYFTPLVSGGSKNYMTPFESFTCCSGSGMENHVKYGDFIYSKGEDGSLFVNLFIPSKLSWADQGVRLTQETELPASNIVKLKLEMDSEKEFTMRLRYPQWAEKMNLKINGKTIAVTQDKSGYISLKKRWKNNDQLELSLKLKLYTVSMPDNPKRVGIFYGPALLAGELGEDNPDITKEIPVLITNNEPVDRWLTQTSNAPLRFKTNGTGQPSDVTLRPFYEMHHQCYVVYWDLFNNTEWKENQQAYRAEQQRIKNLEKITTDFMVFGEMQPERDHNLQGQYLGYGLSNNKKWRIAGINGWITYDMKIQPDHQTNLVITYWGGESVKREFDIYIDGKFLKHQVVYQNKPGCFFEETYSLPEEMTKGKNVITVKLQGVNNSWTGPIYNARTITVE